MSHGGGPAVLRLLLRLFDSLYLAFGPCLKITVEFVVQHVFVKSLSSVLTHFEWVLSEHEQEDSLMMTPEQQQQHNHNRHHNHMSSNSPSSPPSYDFHSNELPTESLEAVVSHLLDLLTAPGFTTSLLASFDCDVAKPDLLKTIVNLLSRCVSYVHRFEAEGVDLKSLCKLGRLVVQCLAAVSNTLASRCNGGGGGSDVSVRVSIHQSESQSRQQQQQHVFGEESGDSCSDGDGDEARKAGRIGAVAACLRQSFLRKAELQTAVDKFIIKPSSGLAYLHHLQQQQLQTAQTDETTGATIATVDTGDSSAPASGVISPSSAASFLRSARGLPKSCIGSYLGELGKDGSGSGVDSKDFHVAVLHHYVRSFDLCGQSILTCMRVFLSAFRLPGEAQQIDRILVAFADHCFCSSLEGKLGVVENAEVSYLLTFAIIMLNTDR